MESRGANCASIFEMLPQEAKVSEQRLGRQNTVSKAMPGARVINLAMSFFWRGQGLQGPETEGETGGT